MRPERSRTMTTVVILLGLLALAGAFPQEEQWRNIYHRVLDVENSDPFPEDDNCVQLAKATFSLLRYSCITHDALPVTINTENLIEIGKKLFGFDVFTDEAALEEFTCNMAKATSVADLKTILDSQNNFNFRLFKLAYDYYTVIYILFGSKGDYYYDVLKSTGLLALDPEGTRNLAELGTDELSVIIQEEQYLSDITTGSVQEKCLALQDLFRISGASENPIIRKKVLMLTGVDLYNRQQVDKLLCAIVKAAEGGIEEVYELLDAKGFIIRFYRAIYPQLVKKVKSLKEDVETFIPVLEESISEMKTNDAYRELAEKNLTTLRLVLNYFVQLERTGRLLDLE